MRTAHRIGHTRTATYLPSCLAEYLDLRRRSGDTIAVHTLARDTAHHQEDAFGEARAWNNLGNALREVRGEQEAREAFELGRGFVPSEMTTTSLLPAATWLDRVSGHDGRRFWEH